MLNNKELYLYLRDQNLEAGFVDKLKVVYRPFISPFSDLLQRINSDDIVFDIGCGSGQLGLLIAAFVNPRAIYGIEIEQRLIENAHQLFKKYPQVETHFDVFDGKNLPDNINKATKILLVDVLHHIPVNIQLDILKQIFNKMHSGGIFILKDIDRQNPFVYFNKLHDLVFAGQIGHEWSMKKAIKVLNELGFEIMDHQKKQMYVYPHYIIIAKKP